MYEQSNPRNHPFSLRLYRVPVTTIHKGATYSECRRLGIMECFYDENDECTQIDRNFEWTILILRLSKIRILSENTHTHTCESLEEGSLTRRLTLRGVTCRLPQL